MLNDYKGEKPNNVITEEEHKKRPFYKKVSFWVLSALGLFFGGCSVYGLVLGYQYVHAVTEAAHIIADAQSDSVVESAPEHLALSKDDKKGLYHPSGSNDVSFDFTFSSVPDTGWYNLDGTSWTTGDVATIRFSYSGNDLYATLWFGNTYRLSFEDYVSSVQFDGMRYYPDTFAPFGCYQVRSYPCYLRGVFHYKPVSTATQTGYDEGHQDGYQEGYDDGYQALAGVQNVRILFDENFPTLNPVNYSWKVDGNDVASGQIMLRPNQSAPVVNLTRPGGYAHKATLNIWSENDQPLIIAYGRHEGLVIGGTQTYIYDTYNKSNAYDWSNSIWYVPTYNPNAGFVIYSYGTAQQGYINDYFFEFDPVHNDRAKTGIYADGYDQGYKDATESGTAYDNGYADGYAEGYDDGKTIGIAQGEAQAVGGQKALVTMFVTAFQQPFDQIYRFLNFNVLGLNILALFTALLTLSIGIIIIKKVI